MADSFVLYTINAWRSAPVWERGRGGAGVSMGVAWQGSGVCTGVCTHLIGSCSRLSFQAKALSDSMQEHTAVGGQPRKDHLLVSAMGQQQQHQQQQKCQPDCTCSSSGNVFIYR